jgi:prepilin-type N-terminal cleavage/methylation domain-containing protein
MQRLGDLDLSGKRVRGGFSLVEILVVLACVAILAAILFPMFARVREAGYQTRCAANLRQLGLAFSDYAQDWNDYWPCPGGRAGDYAYWHQSANGGLVGYVRQHGYKTVWCCPTMPTWLSKYPPRSYTMNSYLRKWTDVEYPGCCGLDKDLLTGVCGNQVSNPSRTILLFEGLPLTWGWEGSGYYIYIYRCCNWTGVKGFYPKLAYTIDPASPWHRKCNNYLYADCHLTARRPGRKTSGELSTYKEMYEWYVDKARFESKLWPQYSKQGAPRE